MLYRKHRILWMMSFCLIFFSLVGCQSAPTSSAEEESPLVIGILPDVESIPLVIAEKNGYFDQTGMDIQLEIFKSARDRDSALQGRQLDGVVTDMIAVAFAQSGGVPLRIAAQTDGNIFLLGRPDASLSSIQDLVGKEVGLSTNTVMEYSLDQMLLQADISPESVTKTAVPQLPTRLEMLQNGQLDAAILPQPFAEIALKGGAVYLGDVQQLGEKAGVLAFTTQALEEKSDAVQAFFTAYNRAVEDLNRSETGTYDAFLIETLGFPESLQGEFVLPEYQPAHLPSPDIFAHVTEWMLQRQLIADELSFEDVSVSVFTAGAE